MTEIELDLTEATTKAAELLWREANPGCPISRCDAWDYCSAQARDLLQAVAPLIERAVREQAAQELVDWAEESAPHLSGPQGTRRRTLHAAARKIGPKMTDQQVVEALQRGDFVACHLDDAGRAIPPAETEVPDAH